MYNAISPKILKFTKNVFFIIKSEYLFKNI